MSDASTRIWRTFVVAGAMLATPLGALSGCAASRPAAAAPTPAPAAPATVPEAQPAAATAEPTSEFQTLADPCAAVAEPEPEPADEPAERARSVPPRDYYPVGRGFILS